MAVYLDHNATSPMHPEVVDAMLPFLHKGVGAAQNVNLEMEHKRHHLGRLRDVFEFRQTTIPLCVAFGQRAPLELVNKLPAVIRQAAG